MGWLRLPLYFILRGVLGWQMWQNSPHPWTWRQNVGLGLVVVGFCFWLIAHIQLGGSFSLTPQARALVTHGLYSKIRNPIYVFSAILIAGVALYWKRADFLWACDSDSAANLAGRKRSARSGEKFEDEYRSYWRRTWF